MATQIEGASVFERFGQLAIKLHLLVAAESVLMGAFLSEALKGRADPRALAALLIVTWMVYAFDRYVVHPEDQVQAPSDLHLLRFARRHRTLFGWMFFAALLGGAALICGRPQLLGGLLWGALLGAAYVVEVPLVGVRLKSVPYLKTIYVPFVYFSTVIFLLGAFPGGQRQWHLVGGFVVLFAINTIICDLKDRENDRVAGIKTLANLFPAATVVAGAQVLCALLGWTFWAADGNLERALAAGSWGMGAALFRFYSAARVPVWYYFVVIDGAMGLPWIVFKLATR